MLSRIWPRAFLPAWFESDVQICAAAEAFFCVRVLRLLCFYTTFFLNSTTSIISNTMIPLSPPLYRFVRQLKSVFFAEYSASFAFILPLSS
jgi:hypothetical protein